MKPLSQMTHEELWALDESEIEQLWESNKYSVKRLTIIETVEDVRNCLDQLRLELQQSAAEARHDTQKER